MTLEPRNDDLHNIFSSVTSFNGLNVANQILISVNKPHIIHTVQCVQGDNLYHLGNFLFFPDLKPRITVFLTCPRHMRMEWRRLCNSEAVNEFPVCLWNEREYCLLQVNIYQNPDTRCSLFATPPFYLSHFFLMCGQKQTVLEPMLGGHPERHTEDQYIWSSLQCFQFLFQQYNLCRCVPVPSAPLAPQTWHVWPSPSSSSSASLYLTSAPAVHHAPGRPSRHVSLEVTKKSGHNSWIVPLFF